MGQAGKSCRLRSLDRGGEPEQTHASNPPRRAFVAAGQTQETVQDLEDVEDIHLAAKTGHIRSENLDKISAVVGENIQIVTDDDCVDKNVAAAVTKADVEFAGNVYGGNIADVNIFVTFAATNQQVIVDHRVIDGAMAAKFVNKIKLDLEDPDKLFMGF